MLKQITLQRQQTWIFKVIDFRIFNSKKIQDKWINIGKVF